VHEEEAVLTPQTISRPTPPKGFAFGSNGGVFMDRMVEDEQGGKSRKQVMLLPYDLFAVDILNSNGDHLVHLLAFRPEGAVDILIPQKSIVSKDETVKALANQNVIAAYGSGNDKNLFDYIRGCVEFISANKRAVKVPNNCGWQADNTFVYNSRILSYNGSEVYVPTPALDNINQSTVPTGTIENWRKVFNMLIAKEEWDEVSLLLNPAKRLTEAFSDSSNVQLKHDHLYYKDRPLDNHLLERALAIVDEGLPDRKSVV
jgi:hypothetical protein